MGKSSACHFRVFWNSLKKSEMSENLKFFSVMKLFLHVVAGLCLLPCAAFAQNYQTQYPYDPYSGSPQPQQGYVQQPQSSGYQTYGGSSNYSGGGYDNKNYSYGSGSGGYSTGNYSNLLTWGQLEAHYAYNDFKD